MLPLHAERIVAPVEDKSTELSARYDGMISAGWATFHWRSIPEQCTLADTSEAYLPMPATRTLVESLAAISDQTIQVEGAWVEYPLDP